VGRRSPGCCSSRAPAVHRLLRRRRLESEWLLAPHGGGGSLAAGATGLSGCPPERVPGPPWTAVTAKREPSLPKAASPQSLGTEAARGCCSGSSTGSDRLGLIWYVDENSDDNALHLALGKVEYDVSYTASSRSGPNQTVPVAFQEPRHRRQQQQVVVERGELKSLQLTGHIKTLAEVRAQ